MMNTVLVMVQVFGGTSVIMITISFLIGLLHTLSIKGALEYFKDSLVIPLISLPIGIVSMLLSYLCCFLFA